MQINNMMANQGNQAPHPLVSDWIKYEVDGQRVELNEDLVRRICFKNDPSITSEEVWEFIFVCRDQKLNPLARDAYGVKYKGKMSIMTSIGAFEKRADTYPEFDGMESGIIIRKQDGSLDFRTGSLKMKDETLVGGWAKVYRKDRSHPTEIMLSLEEYSKDQSTWKQMPAQMIRKCAKAAALREAFPRQNAGLYIKDEMPDQDEAQEEQVNQVPYQQNNQIEHNYVNEYERSRQQEQQKPQPEKAPMNRQPVYDEDNMFA